jgi:hypothetical protein
VDPLSATTACTFDPRHYASAQGLEQQLKAVIAHEDAYHFEAQLDELSKSRQKHADMLAEMAEECAATLTEVGAP